MPDPAVAKAMARQGGQKVKNNSSSGKILSNEGFYLQTLALVVWLISRSDSAFSFASLSAAKEKILALCVLCASSDLSGRSSQSEA